MSENQPLERREVVRELLAGQQEPLIIASTGSPSWDITAPGDRDLNFPLWNVMGGAGAIALGLALAQPSRRVLCVCGDGEVLMGLGTLATIALQAPPNLAMVVLDNESYGETGGQRTHTAQTCDLPGVAAAAGFPHVFDVRDAAELAALAKAIQSDSGPVFGAVKVRAGSYERVLPPRDSTYLKLRFRLALLGPESLHQW